MAYFVTRGMLFVVAGLLLMGCPSGPKESLLVHGQVRTYALHIPDGYTRTTAVPLLVVLHPASTSSERMERITGFGALADANHFIVVYPDGIRRTWNLQPALDGHLLGGSLADDGAFISALLKKLTGEFSIDTKRMYFVGASAGAMLVHRLVLQKASPFAAAATVMGTLPTRTAETANPSHGMPMLIIHGTEDRVVPYDGGTLQMGPGASIDLLSAPETAAFYAAANQCGPPGPPVALPDVNPTDGTTTDETTYPNGPDGADVVLYSVKHGGHTWPGEDNPFPELIVGRVSKDISASAIIWNFLKQHHR